MRKPLLLLLCLSVFSLSAFAEEWTKSYQVGDKPSLRVETNDASVEISRGVSRTVLARVIADGYSIGGSGVRVTEQQNDDKVDLQVHVPSSWGIHFSRIEECALRYRPRRTQRWTCTPAMATSGWTASQDKPALIPATDTLRCEISTAR